MKEKISKNTISELLKAHNQGLSTVVSGGHLEEFESETAKLFGTKYAIATNNGTNAIFAALEALEIKSGSRILVPAYGFYAMLAPLRLYGLEIIFVPFSLETLFSELQDYELALSLKPAAIMTFFPWGNIGPAKQIYNWAKSHSIPVIADLSHSHGAQFANKGIGSYSTISAASFGRDKLISGGELGACMTDDPELANRIIAFGHPNRAHRLSNNKKQSLEQVTYSYGLKLRPHGLSLLIALSQFENFFQRMEARNIIAREMEKMARDSGLFIPLKTDKNASRQYWRIVLHSTNKITKEMESILTKYGFPQDNIGYSELLSEHPISYNNGIHVDRSVLSDNWLKEARHLLRHLLYFKVPDDDLNWKLSWEKALNEIKYGI